MAKELEIGNRALCELSSESKIAQRLRVSLKLSRAVEEASGRQLSLESEMLSSSGAPGFLSFGSTLGTCFPRGWEVGRV